MPHLSKWPLRPEIYDRLLELLVKLLTDKYSKKEAKDLLDDLLSPVERIMIAKRLAIVVLLTKGFSYGEIQRTVRVGKETIAKANEALGYSGRGYGLFVERVLAQEEMKKFLEELSDTFISSTGAVHPGWKKMGYGLRRERLRKSTDI